MFAKMCRMFLTKLMNNMFLIKNSKRQSIVRLFDTFDRKKKKFTSLLYDDVSIYTCGPTVYDFPHIGNMRAYIFSDTLRRVLEFNKYKVKQVINITDVGHLTSDADSGEDKMEASAKKQNRSAREIADFYTGIFINDFKNLNLKEPSVWSRATDHILEQISLIKKLEKLGFTYKISDGVYFDTSKVKKYGNLARLDLKGLKHGARVEVNNEKRNPTDFALWKFSPKDEKRQMEWDSPWGVGFPGWHIECSAMAMKYLGNTIDIHTGGIDHIPVHHTNEIAQSESATGKQFARYWMHVAFLTVEGEKMSKSKGNFTTIKDIIDKGYDPLVFRYLILTSHYRSSFNFTWSNLAGAQKALSSLKEKIVSWSDEKVGPDEKMMEKFTNCINNDINTPQALALMWKVSENKLLKDSIKRSTILEFDKVLGLKLDVPNINEIPDKVKNLVNERELMRKSKKWQESDAIRVQIIEEGFDVEDTAFGPKVTKKIF